MGMSNRDILIALMAALQESGLRNLNYGDRDSLGLFQQRPSAGWGTPQQIMNPVYAATKFFQSLSRIKNRNNMELWQAAQAVQISAFPRAYAKWEDTARGILQTIGADLPDEISGLGQADFGDLGSPQQFLGVEPEASPAGPSSLQSAYEMLLDDGIGEQGQQAGTGGGPEDTPEALGTESADEQVNYDRISPDDLFFETGRGIPGFLDQLGGAQARGIRAAVLNLAKQFIGTPYVFGGAGPGGFDCSGLVQYVLKQFDINVPRLAIQQAQAGKQTSIRNLEPGDLVFWDRATRGTTGHIAFYLGNGKILEAPRTGLSVRIRSLGEWDADDGAIGIKLDY